MVGPRRLFVAGLHGDEWRDTSRLLEDLGEPRSGLLITIPCVYDGPYVSTLDPGYYEGPGNAILEAIEEYRPNVYLELHSYQSENKDRLTSRERLQVEGVPPYIELEKSVLIGSVAPHLRRSRFTHEDLCISFEIPKDDTDAQALVASLLRKIKDADSRDDFLEFMMREYPEASERAVRNYQKFFGLH